MSSLATSVTKLEHVRRDANSLQPHQHLHPPPDQLPHVEATPSPIPPAWRVSSYHVEIARRQCDERHVQPFCFGLEEVELGAGEDGEVGHVAESEGAMLLPRGKSA